MKESMLVTVDSESVHEHIVMTWKRKYPRLWQMQPGTPRQQKPVRDEVT